VCYQRRNALGDESINRGAPARIPVPDRSQCRQFLQADMGSAAPEQRFWPLRTTTRSIDVGSRPGAAMQRRHARLTVALPTDRGDDHFMAYLG
jgi:hypothetical protein